MLIEHFLDAANVHVGLRASDKPRLLADLARLAAPAVALPPADIEGALAAREGLGSTGLGDGIALPHCRLDRIERPFGLVAVLKSALDFDAVDGRPVDLVFLLLMPSGAAGAHLAAMAAAARRLRDPKVVSRLRKAKAPLDAFAILVDPAG